MQPQGSTHTRRIAMINQKGGVGKTTTTVNVSAALARMGNRVLILDLDPQAHATLHLGIHTDKRLGTVYDLLSDPDLDPSAVVTKSRPNLDIIASETDLAAVEGELSLKPDRTRRLRFALDRIAPDYDYIVLDCPPSLGLLTINALAASDEIIIPMQAHFLALQGVGKLLETVDRVTSKINPTLRVSGIVLCAHDLQASHTQEVVQDLRRFFRSAHATGKPWSGGRVFEPPIRRNIKLAESPSFGQTIFEYAPNAAGARDYRALAESIAATPQRRVEQPARAEPAPPTIEVRTPEPAGATPESGPCASSA